MIEETLSNMRQHVVETLRKIPDCRYWAPSEQEVEGLAVFGASWLEERVENGQKYAPNEFEKLMEQLVQANPSLRRPKLEEPVQVPKPWLNPITGQPLGLPKTPDEKAVLARRDFTLLKLMEDLEKKPYQTVLRLQEEKERAARLAAIKYGEAEHKTNPFLHETNQSRLAEFVKQDPERAQVFEWEAKTKISLPWLNGSHDPDGMGRLVRAGLGKYAARASELMRQRAAEQAAVAKAEMEAARQRLEAAQKLAATA